MKLDKRFQYVKEDKFCWNYDTKKVVSSFDQLTGRVMIASTQLFHLNDDFTYDDFLKKYNYHYLVFYVLDNSVIHYSYEGDKYIMAYIEADNKKIRKEKLKKLCNEYM